MLILSLKRQESVYIGNDITVTLVRIGPDAIRIGFEAPNNVNIVRKEVLDRIKSQTKSSQPSEDDLESAV